jgi:glycerophosphoryl diester phosphodiesterase
MPTRPRSTLLAAFWLLTAIFPAAAQTIALPNEAQIGPRPFYLVDKMKDGPLKQQLSQCTGPFHRTGFSVGSSPNTAGKATWPRRAWAPA